MLIELLLKHPFEPFKVYTKQGKGYSIFDPMEAATGRQSPHFMAPDCDNRGRLETVYFKDVVRVVQFVEQPIPG